MKKQFIEKCREMLFKSTEHPEHLVRSEGARLLGDTGDLGAVPYLVKMLKNDHWYCKVTAIYSLGALGDSKAIPVLKSMARDPLVFNFNGKYNHDMIRLAAAVELLKMGDADALDNVRELINIKKIEAFVHFGPAILALPENELYRPLKECVSFEFLKNSAKARFQSGAQARIAESLWYYKTRESLKMIKGYLKHFSRYVRAKAAWSLLKYDDSGANRSLLSQMLKKEKAMFTRIKLALLLDSPLLKKMIAKALKDGNYFTRATAIDAIAETRDVRFKKDLVQLLDDPHFYVRICAIEALEKICDTGAKGKIEKMLKDINPRVRLQAAKYFVMMDGKGCL